MHFMKRWLPIRHHGETPGTASDERRLVRELGWVLVIKTIALVVLWSAFFSDPVDEFIDAGHVQEALFGHPVN